MYFDRRIKYLDYMENGERVKGAGFVKAEVRDRVCHMQICVRGLHVTDHFEKQVILASDKQESLLCKIKIDGGEGSTGELCLDSERMGRGELRYGQIEEIRIPIAAGKEICCAWQEKKRQSVEKKGVRRDETRDYREEPSERDVVDAGEDIAGEMFGERRETTYGKDTIPGEGQGGLTDGLASGGIPQGQKEASADRVAYEGESARGQDAILADIVTQESQQKESQRAGSDQRQQFPLDDKWSQLVSIYPHIAPFEDEREYLSLGPGDFVIFPSRYYRVINNSFLLHGYHNYQHLILSRMEVRGEIRYYVGVPGNFYDKEKQVAMMFGFESFECKQEPARSGDYGYYMMRVEL